VTYEELVDMTRSDEGVLGLVLTGSRGQGRFVTDESDWDVRLVVREDVLDEYRSRFGTPHGSRVEVFVLTLADLAAVGRPGSDVSWDRPSYVHAQIVLDTEGRIAEVVDGIRSLSTEHARSVAAERLDDYVNSYFRSAKSQRLGLGLEAQLDAAESIPPLLEFLFAVHGRVRPFNKHLRLELERRPIGSDLWAADMLLPRLESILATGELAEQQRLFRDVEDLARAHGHGGVIDGWEPDVAWLRGDSEGLTFLGETRT
jgi:predicted nucleotidyltransferase